MMRKRAQTSSSFSDWLGQALLLRDEVKTTRVSQAAPDFELHALASWCAVSNRQRVGDRRLDSQILARMEFDDDNPLVAVSILVPPW
jgi:hypothetical protein